jgi:uncharacterized protein
MYRQEEIFDYLVTNKEYLERNFNISEIGIFGSYSRNEQTEDSDIDIIIECKENTPDLFGNRLALIDYLQKVFNKNVDVCYKKAIKPIFRELILKDARFAL